MDDKTQEKNKPRKSFIGVFDPKEHQERYEQKLDRAYEDVHVLQVKHLKRERSQEDIQRRAFEKARRTNVKRAKKLDSMSDIPADANQKYGSTYFMRYCSSCHTLEGDSRGAKSAAPPLGIIFGRIAGADLHYPFYSESMSRSKVIWTRKNLKEFMMKTQRVIPGTKCSIERGQGVPREAEAWDIAEFLKRFTLAAYARFRHLVTPISTLHPHKPLQSYYYYLIVIKSELPFIIITPKNFTVQILTEINRAPKTSTRETTGSLVKIQRG